MRTPSGRTATSSILGIPTFAHAMGAAGVSTCAYWENACVGNLISCTGMPNASSEITVRTITVGVVSITVNFLGTAGPARVSLEKSGAGQSAYQVHDEDVTAATVDYFNRLGVQKRSGLLDTPFSISVGFMLPHQPFVARQEDYGLYEGQMTMPQHPDPFTEALHPYFPVVA